VRRWASRVGQRPVEERVKLAAAGAESAGSTRPSYLHALIAAACFFSVVVSFYGAARI
jgi:hypothetical protein